MDGWTALRSLLPPKERRGLVLVDPPYEEPGELAAAFARLVRASRRWPTGLLALWYPIKRRPEISASVTAVVAAAAVPTLRLELSLEPPEGTSRLVASGLLVCNPPWTLREEAEVILPALADRLGGARAGFVVEGVDPAGK